ncbi:MAG TPA: glycosyltransferase family 1 protein [Stellaceae bacterium]|jgi:glycosyltransferase involved in cell wall biosynthesis|nr:glycosyltransferase family 1 protein [Stellaceae bacterium]
MSRRIYFDGLNLALERGTGIATYSRLLARLAGELGYEVGVVYASRARPSKNPFLREIAFFDIGDRISRPRVILDALSDQICYPFGVRPVPLTLSGAVVADQFRARLPVRDNLFVARNLFLNARDYHAWSGGRFVDLGFDVPPDIMHFTYQMPIRAKSALNIYTIHDLVPLRLPFTTLDNKRNAYRMLRRIGEEADHIVTVSEHSKRDIVELLGVDEERVTNTYEAVEFPQEFVERPQQVIAEQLRGSFGLEYGEYLLFYGALEPKKNVQRLIDAYLLAAIDIPLVITGAIGWANLAEAELLRDLREDARTRPKRRRRVHHFQYVSVSMLVTLIRGARAVLFPSLYEGFGLPVLEAMLLGTPVVTSRVSSLPEVAGEAALYVNPYETDEIARAIKTIANDADLRDELTRRGRQQAALFSVERYRERVANLYRKIG